MIDALVGGKLLRNPSELKISASDAIFCNFLLSVAIDEPKPVIVSGICFGDAAERISRLCKGDPVAVVGSLKPSEWADKTSGETKHVLNITVNQSLSPYYIKKRREALNP